MEKQNIASMQDLTHDSKHKILLAPYSFSRCLSLISLSEDNSENQSNDSLFKVGRDYYISSEHGKGKIKISCEEVERDLYSIRLEGDIDKIDFYKIKEGVFETAVAQHLIQEMGNQDYNGFYKLRMAYLLNEKPSDLFSNGIIRCPKKNPARFREDKLTIPCSVDARFSEGMRHYYNNIHHLDNSMLEEDNSNGILFLGGVLLAPEKIIGIESNFSLEDLAIKGVREPIAEMTFRKGEDKAIIYTNPYFDNNFRDKI